MSIQSLLWATEDLLLGGFSVNNAVFAAIVVVVESKEKETRSKDQHERQLHSSGFLTPRMKMRTGTHHPTESVP